MIGGLGVDGADRAVARTGAGWERRVSPDQVNWLRPAFGVVAQAWHSDRAHQAWPSAAERTPRARASHSQEGCDPPAGR
jgi:hypothetical protein